MAPRWCVTNTLLKEEVWCCTRDEGRPLEASGQARPQTPASCDRQERWWCCVKKVRERHAVREMKEDPSEPSCRGRLQTAMSCFGQKLR